MKNKNTLNEIKRFQKIAGIISEGDYKRFLAENISDNWNENMNNFNVTGKAGDAAVNGLQENESSKKVSIMADMGVGIPNLDIAKRELTRRNIKFNPGFSDDDTEWELIGTKQDLIDYLTSRWYGMDPDELPDIFPELYDDNYEDDGTYYGSDKEEGDFD